MLDNKGDHIPLPLCRCVLTMTEAGRPLGLLVTAELKHRGQEQRYGPLTSGTFRTLRLSCSVMDLRPSTAEAATKPTVLNKPAAPSVVTGAENCQSQRYTALRTSPLYRHTKRVHGG